MLYVTRKTSRVGRPSISEETKDKVVQLYNRGKNCSEIINAVQISRASFYRIINERSIVDNDKQ